LKRRIEESVPDFSTTYLTTNGERSDSSSEDINIKQNLLEITSGEGNLRNTILRFQRYHQTSLTGGKVVDAPT
jgi:hypothetical protein